MTSPTTALWLVLCCLPWPAGICRGCLAAEPPPAALSPPVRSANFVVEAPEAGLAQEVLSWAESLRSELLCRWDQLPRDTQPPAWPRPVRIVVHRQHPGYYATEFASDGSVTITLWAGDPQLHSTVRHEVCHAVLHLRYPNRLLPRWLDEGLAVCQELPQEQQRLLAPLARSPRRFSTRQLLHLRDYPREVELFYAQSYSLTDFLIRRHGELALLWFLEASFALGQEAALRQVLGYADIEELDRAWWSAVQPSRWRGRTEPAPLPLHPLPLQAAARW